MFAITGFLLSSCNSVKVVSDRDPSVDFSQYKTYSYYGWQENSDQIMNDLDKRRIESAFAEEFRKRGIQYTEEGGDIVVALFVVVNTETTTTAYTNHYGMGGYSYGGYGWGGGWGMGMGNSTTTYSESQYDVGTLVVDVFDAEKKELVWESVGSGTVSENRKGREERIQKAVAKIMAEYPIDPS
jgi:hypothetical protein